jgi:ketosteroid isomerase-like protein
MSRENVEIARRAVEAATRRPKPDFAAVNALYHPDHELVGWVAGPDQGQTFRGAEGFRDWLTANEEAFEFESRLEQARALDQERVLLVMTLSIRGRQSGVAYEQRTGSVVTVREGKVVRTENYPSPEEAIQAVGLRE